MTVSRMKMVGSLWLWVWAVSLTVCAAPSFGSEQTAAATGPESAAPASDSAIAAATATAVSVPAMPTRTDEGYKLRPGDILQVSVWKEIDLQSEVLIRPDGGVSFALAGPIPWNDPRHKRVGHFQLSHMTVWVP